MITNPGLYSVLFENDRVRVLEYRDEPGDSAQEHSGENIGDTATHSIFVELKQPPPPRPSPVEDPLCPST